MLNRNLYLSLLLVLMALALMFTPLLTLAQPEATPEPTPQGEVIVVPPSDEPTTIVIPLPEAQPTMISVGFVVLALVATVLSGTLGGVAYLLYKSAPPRVIELLRYNRPYIEARAEELLNMGDTIVAGTKDNTFDDEAMRQIRGVFTGLLKEFFDAPQPTLVQKVADQMSIGLTLGAQSADTTEDATARMVAGKLTVTTDKPQVG